MSDVAYEAYSKKAQENCTRYNQLAAQRINFDQHWKDVLDKALPEHNNVYGVYAPGQKKGIDVFDNTPTHAVELLAAALHGMLTNPSNYWFWLKTGDPKLDSKDSIKRWLHDCSIRLHEIMNQSNFQTEIHEVYQGLAAIGTWTLYIEEDDQKVVRFLARPIYQSYISENYKGEVDEIHRMIKMSYRQVKQQFSMTEEFKALEDRIKNLHQDEDEIKVLHSIRPRGDYDNGSLPKRFKFESCYTYYEKQWILSESGYREFPYGVPRWSKISGEIYGRSPAMKCLADIKMLNKIMLTQLRGLEKTIDPPLLVADDGVILPVKLTPGGLNFVRAGMENPIRPLQTNAHVDYGAKALEELRDRIRKTFFIDQLQLYQGDRMTTVEVNQRNQENLRVMGPILGRLDHELLMPLIERVFAIALRANKLPGPIPQELSGKKLQIQYSSEIARAQRIGLAENISKVIQMVAPLAQQNPSIMNRVNGDGVIQVLAGVYDLPNEVLRSDKEVKDLEDKQQQAQATAAKQQQEQHQADIINKAGPVALDAQQMQPGGAAVGQ